MIYLGARKLEMGANSIPSVFRLSVKAEIRKNHSFAFDKTYEKLYIEFVPISNFQFKNALNLSTSRQQYDWFYHRVIISHGAKFVD